MRPIVSLRYLWTFPHIRRMDSPDLVKTVGEDRKGRLTKEQMKRLSAAAATAAEAATEAAAATAEAFAEAAAAVPSPG